MNEIKNLEEAWQNRFNEKQEEIERIENKLNEERKSFEGRVMTDPLIIPLFISQH